MCLILSKGLSAGSKPSPHPPKVTVLGRLDQQCSESWSSSQPEKWGPEKVNGLGRSHRGRGGAGRLHFQLQICGGWLESPEHRAR